MVNLSRWRILPLLAAILTACDSRRPAATAETTAAQVPAETVAAPIAAAPPAPAGPAVADTAAPFPGWPLRFNSAQPTPEVQLAGQVYRLSLSARPDSSQPLLYVSPFVVIRPTPAADSAGGFTTEQRMTRGVEVQYTIALHDAGGRPVFTRRLTKQAFRAAVGPEWVTDGDATPPNYLGRWPQRQALVFRFDFAPGPTDFFATALLLLDERTGRTRGVFYEKTYGSTTSPDVPPTLTPNGQTLLLPNELRYVDGRQKSLKKLGYDLAAARLLNDSIVLATYEPQEAPEDAPPSGKKSQTVLINLRGQQLKSFVFSPVSSGLGYWLSYQYLAQTRTHYFYDEAARALLLVPRDAPLQARQVQLSTLPKFELPRRPTEVSFGFPTETGEQVTLWVDTVAGSMRYGRQTSQ